MNIQELKEAIKDLPDDMSVVIHSTKETEDGRAIYQRTLPVYFDPVHEVEVPARKSIYMEYIEYYGNSTEEPIEEAFKSKVNPNAEIVKVFTIWEAHSY